MKHRGRFNEAPADQPGKFRLGRHFAAGRRASMRPRLTAGEEATWSEHAWHDRASMRPRLISRGKGASSARAFASFRFNEAPADQPGNYRPMYGLTTQAVALQ